MGCDDRSHATASSVVTYLRYSLSEKATWKQPKGTVLPIANLMADYESGSPDFYWSSSNHASILLSFGDIRL